ncbi:MAG: hypothetical protein XXXJIFNMEKO3_02239 [Candidatus Erwinia impunctatus]|nr:hypothetical protein XXXJIFNMEKO_02239 [Culicoides impunctatus]
MGLVITDPLFAMQQGDRCIDLVIHLKEVNSDIMAHELLTVSNDDNTLATLSRIFAQLLSVHAHLFDDWNTQLTASQLVEAIPVGQLSQFRQLPAPQRILLAGKLFYLQIVKFIRCALDNGRQYGLSRPELLFRVIGQIINRRCLYTVTCLTEADITDILTTIKPVLAEDPTAYSTIEELLSYSSATTFYQLFQGIFHIEVSTEKGWETLTNVEIHPCTAVESKMGLKIKCRADTGFPAIIPTAGEFPHSASMKITLKRQSHCFPYAIFRDFELSTIDIATRVRGITQLQLFNPEGQVDASQPFYLFGSQPYPDAYVVIANEEIARKSVSQLMLSLHWGGLPRGSDGFLQYYEQYPEKYTNASFQLHAKVLNNGQWVDFGPGRMPLFTLASGVLRHERHLRFTQIKNCYTPITHPWPKTPYSNQSGLRNGLVRLTLAGPESAFGHKEYPSLLSDTLTHNVTSKRNKHCLINLIRL